MAQLTEAQAEHVAGVANVTRIIVGALVVGVMMFGGISVLIRQGGGPGEAGMITFMAAATALLVIPLSFILPRAVSVSAVQVPPTIGDETLQPVARLATGFQTGRILSGALLEGGAFFNLVAYFLKGSWISLAVAAALVLMLIRLIPTKDSAIEWVRWRMDEQQLS